MSRPGTGQRDRILALWDDGMSKRRIAAVTGIAYDQVDRIINYFHGSGEQRAFEAMIAAGSMALAEAIAAARPPVQRIAA